MTHQCQAKTTRGTRCRRQAVAYRRVANADSTLHEVALCSEHDNARRQGALRVHPQDSDSGLRVPARGRTSTERRSYRPKGSESNTPLDALPFVGRSGRPGLGRNFWDVPPVADYGEACDLGMKYAAHFIQYLKDCPFWVGGNVLGDIAAGIDFSDEGAAKGYWVGFFSHLERYIYAAARSADVFADLERQLAISAEIEANRQAEGEAANATDSPTGDTGDSGDTVAPQGLEASPVGGRGPGTPGTGLR